MTNFRMFYAFSIENQHVQFKVDPNSQNVDAAKVAEVQPSEVKNNSSAAFTGN